MSYVNESVFAIKLSQVKRLFRRSAWNALCIESVKTELRVVIVTLGLQVNLCAEVLLCLAGLKGVHVADALGSSRLSVDVKQD